MGAPEFSVPTLKALVAAGHEVSLCVTQPDRAKGREKTPAPPPVKLAALELGLKIIQPERLSEPEAMAELRAADPDAIVVVAFGHILKKEVLALPRRWCVNAHASLLPKYRGAAPIQWAIAEGETRTGITTIFMTERMDAGDILRKREVPIGPADTCASLHDRLAPAAGELVVETLKGLSSGELQPRPQDEGQATYVPLLKKEHGRMDWNLSAESLARRVRAFDPWPGTFTIYQGRQIKVLKALAESSKGAKESGIIIKADKDGILVACREGALRILELQPPGKKPMTASQYLAGHPLATGSRLE